MNGPLVTMSLILPFPKTVEEDDGKPNGKQIGNLPASREGRLLLILMLVT